MNKNSWLDFLNYSSGTAQDKDRQARDFQAHCLSKQLKGYEPMLNASKPQRLATGCCFVLLMLSGCTSPIYEHRIEHHYDAQGKLTGYTDIESLSQQSPSRYPLKVKISHKDKLEE